MKSLFNLLSVLILISFTQGCASSTEKTSYLEHEDSREPAEKKKKKSFRRYDRFGEGRD